MKVKFPGFKILDRYIIKKFLGTFFFAIALIIVVVVVFDAVENVDDFIELKAPLKAIIVDYYFNFVPYFINMFSGLFTFIAVIFFTSKMAGNTEIIAILSSGVSFKRLLWPYFLSALVITLLSMVLTFELIPVANTHRVMFESQYKKRNRTVKYDQHIYRQIYPGTFAYIRNYSGGSNSASYLALEHYEGSTITESLEASDVTFDPETGRWSAPKYMTRRFDGDEDQFEMHGKLDTLLNLTVTELGRMQDLVTTMKYGELNTFIDQQRSKGSDMIAIFEVERQKRWSYPISTFILTLIGVSLSSRKVRGGMGLHIGIGVVLVFTYIMLGRVAEEVAKGSAGIMPTVMVWLPNIIFAFIAAYLYRTAPK